MPIKIKKIETGLAVMEDGRRIRLDLIKDAQAGDYLEIYADLALSKINHQEAQFQRKLIAKP